MEPAITLAREGKVRLFFLDAAHFVYGAFQGYLWSVERLFVKTGSGRERFNVLGAYDPIEQDFASVENKTVINADSVCRLLHKLRYKCGTQPIRVVLDNAKYQRCDLVTRRAKRLNIELLFLPPYSPNLNLIERLWKYVKKVCLNSTYHKNYSDFRSAIERCLRGIDASQQVRTDLRSLLTLKFQVFKDSQLQAA